MTYIEKSAEFLSRAFPQFFSHSAGSKPELPVSGCGKGINAQRVPERDVLIPLLGCTRYYSAGFEGAVGGRCYVGRFTSILEYFHGYITGPTYSHTTLQNVKAHTPYALCICFQQAMKPGLLITFLALSLVLQVYGGWTYAVSLDST